MRVSQKVGFAVVGLGAIAQGSVLPAFAKSKKTKLIATVSRDRAKAARLARKFHAPNSYVMNSFSECLENPNISAVYIATPPGEHAVLTCQAAAAGKHVLCEKPLGARVDESLRMVESCKRHGVLLTTAYRKYFEPSALFLKALIQSGEIGRVDTIQTSFSESYCAGKSIPWLIDSKLAGGGPLMDLGVYCVNTTRWLVDEEPTHADATSWRHNPRIFQDVEEGISFLLRFPSGLVVQGSSSYGAILSSHIFVQGSQGWLSLAPAFPFNEERRLAGRIHGRWIERRFKVTDEFVPQLDAFATAVRSNMTPEPDGVQGHYDVIILNAIYEAAKTGTTVPIHYE